MRAGPRVEVMIYASLIVAPPRQKKSPAFKGRADGSVCKEEGDAFKGCKKRAKSLKERNLLTTNRLTQENITAGGDMNLYLTVKETATILNLTLSDCYEMIFDRALQAHQVKGEWFVSAEAVEEFIHERAQARMKRR